MGSLPPSKPPTGPAPPRRSVCAGNGPSAHSIAGRSRELGKPGAPCRSLRPLPVAALLIAGAAGLLYFGADTGSRRDSDCNSPSIAQCLLDEKSPLDEEKERRRQIYLQRHTVKDRAVQDLLAGRMTLLQAAAQFRDVEKALPVTWVPRIAATGPAEGDACAGVVISMAKGWMEEYVPAQAAAGPRAWRRNSSSIGPGRHRSPAGLI